MTGIEKRNANCVSLFILPEELNIFCDRIRILYKNCVQYRKEGFVWIKGQRIFCLEQFDGY